jgi:hypothetical protein
MSPRVLRHSWLAIAAPFLALSIGRAADGNWRSSGLLLIIAFIFVSVEGFFVLRLRLRNPFYRLRDLRTDAMGTAGELRRFQHRVSSVAAKIVSDSINYAELVEEEERQLSSEGTPPFISDIGRQRRLRANLRQAEYELCDLLAEFRGFFYAPD